jgi:hypothetical protein
MIKFRASQWHEYGIIINNLKCQIGLHHFDRLVEMTEMKILRAFTFQDLN